jgi:hypothetical protein
VADTLELIIESLYVNLMITYSKHVEGVDNKTVLLGGLQYLVDVGRGPKEVRETLLEFVENVQTLQVHWLLLLLMLLRVRGLELG